MTGLLAGVRVVELGGLGPAAWTCTFLSDMGAEVLRIDRPDRTDLDFTENWMRGRARLEVDLKEPASRDRVKELVRRADILIDPFRPGVTERLGLGPEDVMADNNRLIYGRLTGWGQGGPYAKTAGHDGNFIATAGILATLGPADRPPIAPLYYAGDWASGTMPLLVGLLAALYERERSGRGQVVDAAMVDGAAMMLMQVLALRDRGVWTDARQANQLDGAPWFNHTYRTLGDRYMAVVAIEPKFRRLVRETLGLTEQIALDEPDRWAVDRERVAEVFASRTQDEWEKVFAGVDACVSPVRELSDLESEPHLLARGVYQRIDGKLHPAPTPRFSRTPSSIHPPLDSADLVGRWLATRRDHR
ncbi:CoA transferase [Aeromicrobium sp. YIM 150415]|uniref:CaiB/BaiF CoA transferase family protein n=1 Tax=Aeromicrobium sp. YIM 150415 TaxID=2803912 RepID=UPI001964C565|nr:CaiB/BaiF CoA-transferase family protein [Aeromicrobium sp. YIM 150415]MBM9464404.1 CoA transferase [Aeromicrobium sp. YIM 150415]